MRAKSIIFFVLAASVVLTGGAQATVATVTPENMQGWSIATNQNATAGLVNDGYAVAEKVNPWVAQDGTNLGSGAYYATLDYDGWTNHTPPTAWLGLDTFNGQSLAGIAINRITKMEYYAYSARFPTYTNNSSWEGWSLWWAFPRQPIQLQLTITNAGNYRQLWFLPWEPTTDPTQGSYLQGDNCGRHCKKWLRYDCINFNNPEPAMLGYWYSPSNYRQFNSWAEVVAAYGTWTLMPTSNDPYPTGLKSAGWDGMTTPTGSPVCTATGKCLNFEIGARRENTKVYSQTSIAWINNYSGFRGYVDHFTLGIDGTNVTYDFEPSAQAQPPHIVCASNRSAWDSAVCQELKYLNPADPTKTGGFPAGYLVKVFGKSVYRDAARASLDDGSGRIIHAFLIDDIGTPRNPVPQLDEYWSAWGILERPIGMWGGPLMPPLPAAKDGPWFIWTAREHMAWVE